MIKQTDLVNIFSSEFLSVRKLLHRKCGVYRLFENDELMYVGMSIDLATRSMVSLLERDLFSIDASADFYLTSSVIDASILELVTISVDRPQKNGQKFDSSPSSKIEIPFDRIDRCQIFDHDAFYELHLKFEKQREENAIREYEQKAMSTMNQYPFSDPVFHSWDDEY